MRLTKVKVEQINEVNKNKNFTIKNTTVEIYAPVPTVLSWHQSTQWKEAEQLKAFSPETWTQWVKKGLVPQKVVLRVDGEQKEEERNAEDKSLKLALKISKLSNEALTYYDDAEDFLNEIEALIEQKKKEKNSNNEEFQIQ